ncbi:MAG: LysR family transcriptional regulator [Burkholderiaceae bacterium]
MNFRTLDLNLLRVFDEVMAEKNLTRAARKLSMTQPAVSNALRRLRDALGDELVVRSGHGVEPTPAARQWWPAVRDALDQLRNTFAPGEFDPTESRASFTIAMADATAALLIPSMVSIIESEAPGVTLRVQPLTTRDPRVLLETQDIDLAIGYFPVAIAAIGSSEGQEDSIGQFGTEQLYSSDYICVMRRGHPLASAELTLDAYCQADHLLVSFSGRPFGFIDEALAAHKRRRRVVLTVNQFFTAGMVVANSNLLTVLPGHFLASTGMGYAFETRPMPFQLPRVNIDSVWHSRRAHRPGHDWLRGAIRRSARHGRTPPYAAVGGGLGGVGESTEDALAAGGDRHP